MNRFLLISLAAIATPALAQSKPEPIALTTSELVDAYRANPIAAKRRFSGQAVRVTGSISGIQEGKDGAAHVYFGGVWEGYVVDATTSEDTAATLITGQKVTFKCGVVRGGKRFARDVILESCRLL